ncbi:MAG TPA: hypothetical protein VJB98_00975 [Candidatus Paceibacterota bacterium]
MRKLLILAGFIFLTSFNYASAVDCTGTATTTGSFFQNFSSAEYSASGLLILHFKVNPTMVNVNRTIDSDGYLKNDECDFGNRITGFDDTYVDLPRGATDFSVRFSSPTHYDIWNDASSTPLVCSPNYSPANNGCSQNIPDYPDYYTFGYDSAIQIGTVFHHIRTAFYPIVSPPTVAPVLDDTLPTPAGCQLYAFANNFQSGTLFDNYERAEYVDGLLRVHYRFKSPFNSGGGWKARMRVHNGSCVPSLNTFPASNNASTTPWTRYFSLRFLTPTHWELWNDELNKKEICTLCQGDVPAGTPYVSFIGSNTAVTSYFRGTPYPVVEPTRHSSVIFIPGIEATRLYTPSTFGADKLWEPTLAGGDVRGLFLDEQGNSLDPDIYAGDIIDEAPGGGNIYNSFIDMMDDLVDDGDIEAWEPLSYDWRLDYNQVLEPMVERALLVASSSQTKKVTIIAHSHGGLVAKALISRLVAEGYGDKVDKLILVAVPQTGTPEAVAGLLHGDNSFGFPGNIVITRELFRGLAEHSQAAFNLLPTQAYFARVTSPVVEFDTTSSLTSDWRTRYGNTISDSATLRAFMSGSDGRPKPAESDVESPNVLAANFLDQFAQNSAFQDSWQAPTSTQVIQIAGWGLETLRGTQYTDRLATVCNADLSVCLKQPILDERPLVVTDGDKTVISYSADALATTTYYVDLLNYNNIINLKLSRDHSDILEVQDVLPLLSDQIRGTSTPLSQFIFPYKPTDSRKSKRLSVHSPVSIDVYDNSGSHTGLAPNPIPGSDLPYLEEQIPNSRYYEFGDGKYVSVPSDDTYNVVIKGTGDGAFTLESEEGIGGAYAGGPIFSDIPVSPETVATLSISSTTDPVLSLDVDGDGSIDVSLSEGEVISAGSLLDILEYQVSKLGLTPKQFKKFSKKIAKIKESESVQNVENVIDRLNNLTQSIKKALAEGNISLEEAQQLMQLITQIKESI